MQQNILGRTGRNLGVLGYSERPTRRDPATLGPDADIYQSTPQERADVVQAALDAGVTLFHAAHEREAQSLGQSLQTLGVRDRIILSTTDGDALGRCPDTEDGAFAAVRAALVRKQTLLGTDHINLFSLYDIRREVHTAARLAGAARALADAQADGTAARVGVTCAGDFDALADIISVGTFAPDLVLAHYNYADPRANARLFPLCRERGIGVICTGAWDWTGTGVSFTRFPNTWRLRNMAQNFAGLSAGQAHLRWVMETARPDCILVSVQTAAQVAENAAAWTVAPSKNLSGMTSLLDEFVDALFRTKEGWRGLLIDPDWEVRAAAEAKLAQRGKDRPPSPQ